MLTIANNSLQKTHCDQDKPCCSSSSPVFNVVIFSFTFFYEDESMSYPPVHAGLCLIGNLHFSTEAFIQSNNFIF